MLYNHLLLNRIICNKFMQFSLYNTLKRNQEIFKPLNNNVVKMYVCGPTVYDRPHLGNARSVVVYDILYRILMHIFGTKNVLYVRNITDIDDKIINRANILGIKISDLTNTTTTDFHHDMAYLGCLSPNIEPKATEHISEMITIIEKLINLRYAYISNGHVYFDVLKPRNYHELSGRSFNEMLEGVRIEIDEAKRHPEDFVLWKLANKEDNLSEVFSSPWGIGRPGWHIECSAMSYKYLGQDFDIHGGGADLIFPHHTNEIAQSTCAFPNSQFARFWVHNGFLTVSGEKMSKSLGNFITVKDLIDKKLSGEVIRLFLLSVHYRKPLDFNDKALNDATKMINYWYRAIKGLDSNLDTAALPDDFLSALLEDMNTPLAIKIINDYAKLVYSTSDKDKQLLYASLMLKCANFIGLMTKSVEEWFGGGIDPAIDIEELILQRSQAKKEKNWALADKIRQDLLNHGIVLEDGADGLTTWRKKSWSESHT